MTSATIRENYDYVQENLSYLLKLYRFKYILVHNKKVVGSFDTVSNAAREGVRNYGTKGDFLIEFISDLPENNYIASSAL